MFCCWSPDGVRDFGDWAGRDVQYVVDFSLRRTWNDIANPFDQLKSWQDEDYRIVFGLAMLPEDDSLDVSLAAGARGDYDEYYRTLAQNLVAYGQGDAVLRLGWEFNLGSWRWHPGEADDFIAYWRRVVTTMRAVPGAEGLAFDWNVNNGGNTYDSTRFYPGRDYVDYVASTCTTSPGPRAPTLPGHVLHDLPASASGQGLERHLRLALRPAVLVEIRGAAGEADVAAGVGAVGAAGRARRR